MEVVKSCSSDLVFLQRKMVSFSGFVAFETLIAAHVSLACVLMMVTLTRGGLGCTPPNQGILFLISNPFHGYYQDTGFLLQDAHTLQSLIGNDQRFPFTELHKKGTAGPEAKDGSDTEGDDEDEEEVEEPEDDAGDEDFSGDEKEVDDDDDEGDAEDPAANGNEGSDDEEDNDDEDDDDDDDDDDNEDNEDEDEEEKEEDEDDDDEAQPPPAKKRK